MARALWGPTFVTVSRFDEKPFSSSQLNHIKEIGRRSEGEEQDRMFRSLWITLEFPFPSDAKQFVEYLSVFEGFRLEVFEDNG